MMPACGTFDYVGIVPEGVGDGGFECRVKQREPIAITGDALWDSRLTGIAPIMKIVDAGLTPDPGPDRPRVLRSRISLIAEGKGRATVAEASMHVDKSLISCCRPGDSIHLARTACGGLGISITRQGELVAAVGAITAVPLGPDATSRTPLDLVGAAQAVFRKRDLEFEFHAYPLEVSVGGSCFLLFRGRRVCAPYEVFVQHGRLWGIPGTDECAAICRKPWCPIEGAIPSAILLDGPAALLMTRW